MLGGLQGAIGWLMVASGLKPGMTAVAPVKLMLHLTTASIIFAGLVATATSLGRTALVGGDAMRPRVIALRRLAGWIVFTVLLQIAIGALVAGSKAGLIYNTWPLIDGTLVPPLSGLFFTTPWYREPRRQSPHRAVRTPYGGLSPARPDVVAGGALQAGTRRIRHRRGERLRSRASWPPRQ